jgi:hypothetical protein
MSVYISSPADQLNVAVNPFKQLSEWHKRRVDSGERNKSFGASLALLLPKTSQLKRWHRHPEDRPELTKQFVRNPWETYLVVVDKSEIKEIGVDNIAQANAVLGLVQGTEDTDDERKILENAEWLLLEPLETVGGVRKFRNWDKTTAIMIDQLVKAGQARNTIINPSDAKKRKFSADSVTLCIIIANNPKFTDMKSADAAKAAFKLTVNKRWLDAGKGAIAFAVVGCMIATSACTGVGAFTISAQIAESIVKGAASSLGQQGAAALTGGAAGAAAGRLAASGRGKVEKPLIEEESSMPADQLLRARIERLEDAVFFNESEEELMKLGNKVTQSKGARKWFQRG